MNKSIQFILLLIGLVGGLAVSVQAQDCASIQRQARRLYEQGNIDEALVVLKSCMDNKQTFDKSEPGVKADMYWLASQIYLLKKDSEMARKSFKEMLAYRPYYEATEEDMQDIPNIRKTLWVMPRLEFAVNAEAINSTVHIKRSHKVLAGSQSLQEDPKTYNKTNLGAKVGVGFRYKLSKHWELSTGLEVWAQQFVYQYGSRLSEISYEGLTTYDSLNRPTGIDTTSMEEYSLQYEYKHTQSMVLLAVPVVLKHHFIRSERFMPYVEAGLYGGYLITANRLINFKEIDTYSVTNLITNTTRTKSKELPDVFDSDTKALYVEGNFGYIFGAGIDFTIRKKMYFGIGARYQASFFTHTRQAARFSYEDLLYSFYDLQDDFSLRNLSVALSWRIPLSYKAFDK